MLKTKQIITITITITAIIFFVLGCFISGGVGMMGENTFQAGWDAAKKRLTETGFFPNLGDEATEIKSVNGVVQEIKGDKITLKIQPLEPLADSKLDIRVIEVGEAKIYQLVQKDMEEFQNEIKEFKEKMQAQLNDSEEATEQIVPPEFFLKQEISLDKIKIDQQITVIAGEDIKEIKQFEAIEVVVQFMPVISQVMEDTLENPQMTEVEM